MDDPIDLSPLDPRSDPARFDRMVRGITEAAMAPSARPPGAGLLGDLLRWSRPALAAAALVALVAGAALFSPRPPAVPPDALLEAVGIPAPLGEWARANRYPSAAELLAAFPLPGDPAAARRAP
jgi:hypothetical protein